jgi:tRNA dimethylallyltransferase
MFYFNALERGLTELPQADQALRDNITDQAGRSGWPVLHQRLAALDPQSADRIDPMDAQRIQRALEIVLAGGKPVAAHNNNRKLPPPNPLVKIALAFSDRAVLHQRIARRFDIMLDAGLEVEVSELLASGVDANAPSMRMIGYRQMLEHLGGEIDLTRMRDKGIIATRQLAKRQLTWLRNQNNLLWWVDRGLEDKEFQELVTLVRQYV